MRLYNPFLMIGWMHVFSSDFSHLEWCSLRWVHMLCRCCSLALNYGVSCSPVDLLTVSSPQGLPGKDYLPEA